ncbi:hypothetical protein AAG906_004941 [Vitis piasezkii]
MEYLAIRSDDEMMDRVETVLQVAMMRLEDEFCHILIWNTVLLDADRLHGSIRQVLLSFLTDDGRAKGGKEAEEILEYNQGLYASSSTGNMGVDSDIPEHLLIPESNCCGSRFQEELPLHVILFPKDDNGNHH